MSASERERRVHEDLIGAAMHLARRHGAVNVHARLAAVMGLGPATGDSSPLEPVSASETPAPGAVSPAERGWTRGPLKAGASHVQTDNGVMTVVAQTYSGCDTSRPEARSYAVFFAAAPALYEACFKMDEAVKAGHDNTSDLLMHLLEAASLARAALLTATQPGDV